LLKMALAALTLLRPAGRDFGAAGTPEANGYIPEDQKGQSIGAPWQGAKGKEAFGETQNATTETVALPFRPVLTVMAEQSSGHFNRQIGKDIVSNYRYFFC
jgi:hypothetical protein